MRKIVWFFLISISLSGVANPASRGFAVEVVDKSGQKFSLYNNSYALLIGVSDYDYWNWPDLESIPSELASVERLLGQHGFQIEKHLNPNGDQLETLFENFIDAYGYEPGNRLLFFSQAMVGLSRMGRKAIWSRRMRQTRLGTSKSF